MTNVKFVSKLKDIVDNYSTTFMWGVFGSPITEQIIRQKSIQYPTHYTRSVQTYLRSLIGKKYFGFDCVCLIKGVLWGWNGNIHHPNGGAIYKSAGVPDINANSLIQVCTKISPNFHSIEVGELLYRNGHVGIYIGEGKAIEMSTLKEPTSITGVSNICNISGIANNSWEVHGRLPYITYICELESIRLNSKVISKI